MHRILCYRIKNTSFMVFIKQLKPRIFVLYKQTGALTFKVKVVNSIPSLGLEFFFLSFPPLLSLLSLHVYPGVCASVGRVLCVYLAGFLTIDFDHKHSSGCILAGLYAGFLKGGSEKSYSQTTPISHPLNHTYSCNNFLI